MKSKKILLFVVLLSSLPAFARKWYVEYQNKEQAEKAARMHGGTVKYGRLIEEKQIQGLRERASRFGQRVKSALTERRQAEPVRSRSSY